MGFKVAVGRYVPAGPVIRTQEQADALPAIDESYLFAHTDDGLLHNHALAEGDGHTHAADEHPPPRKPAR
jgi:hypothetical protein